MSRLRIAVLLVLLGPLPACPQATSPTPTKVESKAGAVAIAVAVDDPRAVNATEDYYPASDRGTPLSPPPAPASPGTGQPDETNGKCRLFAPELPDPECCERQLGFDVETVKRACGLKLYLGESFYASCGFYFLPDVVAAGVPATWFRISNLHNPTPKQAAEEHQTYTRKSTNDPSFTAVPIPGIEGAYWSEREDLHWAFLPGWSVVRQFTWKDDSCTPEGLMAVLRALVAAPEIAAGTGRQGLIPVANPPPAIIPDPGSAPAETAPADPAGAAPAAATRSAGSPPG
ncbi:MAG: hypothetical protein H0T76_26560 [Nannocystis sp.]|nr:hypothetical protein [Nannocystis sp.]MBA3550057.1 hypothetical protein [Nannocystis sp.]